MVEGIDLGTIFAKKKRRWDLGELVYRVKVNKVYSNREDYMTNIFLFRH